MRKKIFFVILLFAVNIAKSQVYTGIHLNNNYVMDKDLFYGYGAGGDIIVGYKMNKNISADIQANKDLFTLDYFSPQKYIINSYYFKVNYIITSNRVIFPYISLGTGFFQKKTDIPIIDYNNIQPFYILKDYLERGIGIIPSLGFEFKHPSIQNLNWDIGFSYKKIFTEHPVNLIQLKIGLLYYFNKKASKIKK